MIRLDRLIGQRTANLRSMSLRRIELLQFVQRRFLVLEFLADEMLSHMNRCWIILSLLTIIGCQDAAPVTKPVVPKDMVRVEPGPVDSDALEEFTTTESGLKYRIRRKSDGKKPVETDVVRIHYRGQLDDGRIFGSTYGRTGGSVRFPMIGTIKGWAEGLQLTGDGGMIELEIPPELGYGSNGPREVPPNSTLHFIVEVLEVNPQPIAAPAVQQPESATPVSRH